MKERIEEIMQSEELTASKFADAIGVQRSNISHILSGRNKPSLELVNKILDHFDQINADWLLLGKGSMMSNEEHPNGGNKFAFETKFKRRDESAHPTRIIIFYSDNSFEEFRPR